MKKRAKPFGWCGLWACSALAALAAFEILASLPRLPETWKVTLAIAGYVCFVLFFGCALRAWRSDWAELWRTPRRDHPTPKARQPGGTALAYRRRIFGELIFRD
ncbi:MAG TPA: hypothetical protein VJA66_08505 [Thermoanaerobaculia bacterium]